MIIVIALLAILVVVLIIKKYRRPAVRRAYKEKQITIVFRFDDYSEISSTDLEVKLINAFQKYGVPCTFGVIPYVSGLNKQDENLREEVPLSPEKAEILRNAISSGILEVALHGCSHRKIGENASSAYTEFSGLDYDAQVKSIERGKNYLEEILDLRLNTFIPPWNSYDSNTLRALEDLGFKTISADVYGIANDSSQLNFLPAMSNPVHLRETIMSARHSPDNRPVIIVLVHPNDFFEINKDRGIIGYKDFEELLAWISSQKDIHVCSIDQLAGIVDDSDAGRLRTYRSYLEIEFFSVIPPFLYRFLGIVREVYFSSKTSYNFRVKYWTLTMLFYLAILFISTTLSFIGGSIIFPKAGIFSSVCRYGGLVMLFAVVLYSFRNLAPTYKGVTAMITILGLCIGMWLSL